MFNRAGAVAFSAGVNGGLPPPFSGEGIWLDQDGVRTSIVLGRESISGEAGLEGFRFDTSFELIGINDSNQIAWRGTVDRPGFQPRQSIWRYGGGEKHPVAFTQMAAPGLPSTTFGELVPPRAYNEVFGNAGKVGFWANLSFDGLTQLNNESLWSGAPGAVQVVVREGFPIPGTPALSLGDGDPALSLQPKLLMNASGAVAFAGPTRPNGGGIWTGVPGQPYTRAATANPNSFSLNDAGRIAYDLGLTPGIEEVRLFAGGVTTTVARTNVASPAGPGVVYNRFSNTVIGGDDRVLFRATLSGEGVTQQNDSGLFMRNPDGTTRMVVREGAPAAGAGGVFDGFGQYALNAVGMVAFLGNRQAIPGDGLWVVDVYNQQHLIALEDAMFEVAPGDVRLVREIQLPSTYFYSLREGFSTGGQDGLPTVLSDNGQVLFRLVFSDLSSGLFMATVPIPAPATGGLVMMAAGVAVVRRRRG